MSIFIELIPTGIIQGLILSIMALGVTIPFRILNFPDFTGEGSYPLGGALCAALIISGIHPGIATLTATICGGLIGVATALLYLNLRINTILAGIIVSTMVYSLNLRFMGKPNLALFEYSNLFSGMSENVTYKIITLVALNLIIIIPIMLFLRTEIGLQLRTVGMNKSFASNQSINVSSYTILGLFIGNALCGLAGSMIVQLQNYADIGMGTGIVVHALAGLMIGEVIIEPKTITRQIIAPFIGALIYQQIQGLAITIGMVPSDLKILTGGIVLFVLMMRRSVSVHKH